MNNYDDFKRDNFTTVLTNTMIIDIPDDDKTVYIIFKPMDEERYSDTEHALMAEVYTSREASTILKYQFGVPCNYGDELAIREMVIKNYLNDNLFWVEHVDDDDDEETASLYEGDSLDDKEIIKTIKKAADDYEDGAILEAHDKLLAVVDAIAEFNKDHSDD